MLQPARFFSCRFHVAILLCLSFFLPVCLVAQADLAGLVVDSTGAGVVEATVVLFLGEDTSYHTHTFTDFEGEFLVRNLEVGFYWLRVSKPGYESYIDSILISTEATLQLPPISLYPKGYQLAAIDILGRRSPVVINGDTVSYDASAFGTRQNAMMDQLLEQLPGIDINDEGKVEAQGQQIQKITLNGKEFFGQNTQVALDNIPADLIDKVQVVNTKVKQGDGTYTFEPVLNVKLKGDKNSGVFGTLEGGYGAGYGADNRYVGKLGIHRFSSGSQMSVLALSNNINAEGFSWREMKEFMGGWDYIMPTINNGEMVWWGNDDGPLERPFDTDAGFTTIYGTGANLNTDLSAKTVLNFNYIYGHARQVQRQTNRRETILEEGSLIRTGTSGGISEKNTHALTLHLNHEFDSLKSVSLGLKLGVDRDSSFNDNESLQETSAGLFRNQQVGGNQAEDRQYMGTVTLHYNQEFPHTERGLYISLAASGNLKDIGRITFNNLTYADTTQNERLLQNDAREEDNGSMLGQINYYEPLAFQGALRLSLQYGYFAQITRSARNLFQNETSASEELFLQPEQSNAFQQQVFMHAPAIGLYYEDEKKEYGWRGGLRAEVKQFNMSADYQVGNATLDKNYFYLLPNANLGYRSKKGFYLRGNVYTRVNIPRVGQLQPFIINANPLNVNQGNPDLEPSIRYANYMRIGYRPRGKDWSINVSSNLGLTTDNMIQQVIIDSLGRQTRMPVNRGNASSYSVSVSFGAYLPKLDLSIRPYVRLSSRQSILYINGIENTVRTVGPRPGIRLSNRKNNIFRWRLSGRWDLTDTRYNISEARNRQQLNQRYQASITLTPNDYFAVGSDLRYRIFTGTAFEDPQEVPIWSADCSFYPKANSRWEIKLVAQDILNRNLGVRRNINNNFVSETISETIGRYFLVTVVYRLSSLSVSEGKRKYRKGK